MAKDLSILLGLHDADILEWSKISAETAGFSVYSTSCLKDMKVLMKGREYVGYLMDLNLRSDGGIHPLDITPAREVYALIRERVERQEAVFLGVSGRDEVVEAALKEQIPAEIKPFHIFPFLHRCREMGTK